MHYFRICDDFLLGDIIDKSSILARPTAATVTTVCVPALTSPVGNITVDTIVKICYCLRPDLDLFLRDGRHVETMRSPPRLQRRTQWPSIPEVNTEPFWSTRRLLETLWRWSNGTPCIYSGLSIRSFLRLRVFRAPPFLLLLFSLFYLPFIYQFAFKHFPRIIFQLLFL